MEYEFTYESEVITDGDLCCELQVTVKVKCSRERNYANVMCASMDTWEVTSIVKASGEDLTCMFQGTNDLTREVTHELLKHEDKIIGQYWPESRDANV